VATEQLGTGNPAVDNVVPGNLVVGGTVKLNGVTTPAVVTTVSGATTGFEADAMAAINGLIEALADLGLIVKG
jgi:hypothetical protein